MHTKPRPYIFTLCWKDVGMNEALYIYLHFYILPGWCWCTFWHAIPTSLFVFNDFSVLFLYLFGNVLSYVVSDFCDSYTYTQLQRFTLWLSHSWVQSQSHVPTSYVTHNCSEEPRNMATLTVVECDKLHVCLSCNTDVNIDPASSQVFQKFNLLYISTKHTLQKFC